MAKKVLSQVEQKEHDEALQRTLERLQKGRLTKAKQRRAQVITEQLSRPRAAVCHCGIRPDMTIRELMDLGAGCTTGQWVCPTLDAIRRILI